MAKSISSGLVSCVATATQTGNDTSTYATIATGLTDLDTSLWSIVGARIYWSTASSCVAADAMIHGILTRSIGATNPANSAEILRGSWATANTGGVAVTVVFDPAKEVWLPITTLTAQPNLYFYCTTTNTAATNVMYVEVFYELAKAANIEVKHNMVRNIV